MFIPPASLPPEPTSAALPAPPLILAAPFDGNTGDAVSFLAGADPLEASIAWQFTVRQGGGSALGGNGHRLHTIKYATTQVPLELEAEARRVVQKFVTRGQLANVDFGATVSGGSTATGVISGTARNVIADRAIELSTGGA